VRVSEIQWKFTDTQTHWFKFWVRREKNFSALEIIFVRELILWSAYHAYISSRTPLNELHARLRKIHSYLQQTATKVTYVIWKKSSDILGTVCQTNWHWRHVYKFLHIGCNFVWHWLGKDFAFCFFVQGEEGRRKYQMDLCGLNRLKGLIGLGREPIRRDVTQCTQYCSTILRLYVIGETIASPIPFKNLWYTRHVPTGTFLHWEYTCSQKQFICEKSSDKKIITLVFNQTLIFCDLTQPNLTIINLNYFKTEGRTSARL